MSKQPYPASLPVLLWSKSYFQKILVPTILHKHMDGLLTQLSFHRVQEHPKRSLDEEVVVFRSWRSHMSRQPYPASLPNLPCPKSPFQKKIVPTTLHRNMNGILTQCSFHRVQEHPKQSLNEEVMTPRSWRSHMSRQPYSASLPDQPFLKSLFRNNSVPTILHRHMARILTQWDFHRV